MRRFRRKLPVQLSKTVSARQVLLMSAVADQSAQGPPLWIFRLRTYRFLLWACFVTLSNKQYVNAEIQPCRFLPFNESFAQRSMLADAWLDIDSVDSSISPNAADAAEVSLVHVGHKEDESDSTDK